MTAPMDAPVIAPDNDTVRARKPSHDTNALTATAHGSAAMTAGRAAITDAAVTSLAIHITNAAVAGTEILSSSLIGSVSTIAAANAARSGAPITNPSGGSGVTADRVHHVSATPPSPPQIANAAVPAIVLSRF